MAFQLWLSLACLSASCGGGGTCVHLASSPLVSLSPLFCERARLCIRLEPFAGRFFFFFFPLPGYLTVWIAISGKLPQIVLKAFRPGPYPKHAACASLFSPHLLVAGVSIWATSLQGVAVRIIICGFYLFFLPIMLPSEIPKLPTDLPVRGFPGKQELLPL